MTQAVVSFLRSSFFSLIELLLFTVSIVVGCGAKQSYYTVNTSAALKLLKSKSDFA